MLLIPNLRNNNESKVFSHSTHYSNINGDEKINTTNILRDYRNGHLDNIVEKKTKIDNKNESSLEIVGKHNENGHYLIKINDKKNAKTYLVPKAILAFIQSYFLQLNFKQLQKLLKVFDISKKNMKSTKSSNKKKKIKLKTPSKNANNKQSVKKNKKKLSKKVIGKKSIKNKKNTKKKSKK